jgi:hypothetical protein
VCETSDELNVKGGTTIKYQSNRSAGLVRLHACQRGWLRADVMAGITLAGYRMPA